MRRRLDKVLDGIIEQHRAAASDGDDGVGEDGARFVDVLLKFEKDGTLTTDLVKALLVDMFVAGTDMSATTVEWAMPEMIRNPSKLNKAQEEGWILGRDPEYWNDAEKFIRKRFEESSHDFQGSNLEYMPFGAGRRICPGVLFGLANVEILLAMLLFHFDCKMPNGMKHDELDMTEAFGATVNRKHHLCLIPIVKRPLCACV
ncbi:salviol synthase-like [Salvia divinorum]|uniref:Salviol synthase-like n=1 Tax=Salvia divinorum TaxID=28513 RepID=A0ABD1G4N7_SALDI